MNDHITKPIDPDRLFASPSQMDPAKAEILGRWAASYSGEVHR